MNLIAVRSYDDYISAHLMMGRLKEESITCFLKDEHSVTIGPFLSNIIGGIKLMVPEAEFEKALELLNQFEKGQNEE
jgi:putative signal transducing protein